MSAPDFHGRLEEFLAWAEENYRSNPDWCPRHWAPCPVEGKNGLLASVLLIGEAFAFYPSDLQGPDAINAWRRNQVVPTCCLLGDEKMNWLWWFIGLHMEEEEGLLCLDNKNVPNGRHVCFYEKGHEDPHEHTQPPASIFKLMERPNFPKPE